MQTNLNTALSGANLLNQAVAKLAAEIESAQLGGYSDQDLQTIYANIVKLSQGLGQKVAIECCNREWQLTHATTNR
jgi:EAL domain-containing protein (putative c-di-GMP-specific phosphodiesterase class I)